MTMRNELIAGLATGLLLAAVPAPAANDQAENAAAESRSSIPAHPSRLAFGPLEYDVPRAEKYRHELSSGIPVYVVEDHALPLVDVRATVRLGSFLDPEGEEGLAWLTGTMLRQGGAGSMTAEELDERADFLAVNISSSAGETSGQASLDSVTETLDEGLDLFFEMLKSPRFQESRLEIVKSNRLEEMKQRNDRPSDIQAREWQWLLYGQEHFSSRLATKASLDAIDREDLVSFHRRYWRPENMVLAVSGAVDTESILAELESRFAEWPGEGAADVPWPPPKPVFEPTPGVYHVEKEIPQSRVQIGHRTLQWDEGWSDPKVFAAIVMNDILGGGGFTSRIMSRIRSDEGLAYSAGSRYDVGPFWPGSFRVYYQSKSATVAYAAQIALEEIRRIQSQPVSEEELRTAKSSFVETFPRRFESSAAIAGTFANDEHLGRPHDYWYEYRSRIQAVDEAAVQGAASSLLHPDRLVFLVVGPWAEVAPGDADGKASMEEFFGGEVTHLPSRDPLTLEPME